MAFKQVTVSTATEAMLEDLQQFIAGDLNTQYPGYWSILEYQDSAAGGSYNTGKTARPLVVRHSNQIVGEEVNVHIWRSSSDNFGLNLSTDYVGDGGVNPATSSIWYNQTNRRLGEDGSGDTTTTDNYCRMNQGTATIDQYYFFGYQEYVYVVLRTSQGIWRNFAFGHIDKIDDFSGGGFCCASFVSQDNTYKDSANAGGYIQFFDNFYTGATPTQGGDRDHCSQIRCDLPDGTVRYLLATLEDNITGTYITNVFGPNDTWGYSGSPYYPSTTSNIYIQPFEAIKVSNAPSTFGLTSPLVPIYIYKNRGNSQRSLVGVLPHVFCLNIRDIVETSEIDIQGTPYVVFPASRKTSTSGQYGDNLPNSYRYGFCLEKII